jgi:hypothetical protein
MTRRICRLAGVLGLLGVACLAGCSDVPKAPPWPDLSASAAAKAAIARYDTNGDGKLDAKELEQSPPLKSMLATIKAQHPEHDNSLTADDIAGRVRAWLDGGMTLGCPTIRLLTDAAPLKDAVVTLVPEPWLGSSYKTPTGTTDDNGVARLTPSVASYPGIYVGAYRVTVSKKVNGQETVPPRYNEKTELGLEVAEDVPHIDQLGVFHLQVP